jgi:polysaccharide export outer membrane protein
MHRPFLIFPRQTALPSLVLLLAASLLSGCVNFLPNSGPSAKAIQQNTPQLLSNNIRVVELTPPVVRFLLSKQSTPLFSNKFPTGDYNSPVLGAGDSIEVSVFEAPPSSLFAATTPDVRGLSSGSRPTTLPEQVINAEGTITIPFAGELSVAGLRVRDVQEQIALQLKDKANQPQILARQTRNATAHVTVIGEVNASIRMPLTAARERLMDALAAAGGLRQQVSKITIQITRGSAVHALPLETIVADPKQNIPLQPGDLITVLSQPLSFTALGATGKNEEINFEAKGINLAQALARAGGLADSRSHSKGVFIFRFEDNSQIDSPQQAKSKSGKTPVIYNLNLSDPGSFFLAKSFPMKDGDTLYISNAPAAELQKFMNIVATVAYPIMSVTTTSAALGQ